MHLELMTLAAYRATQPGNGIEWSVRTRRMHRVAVRSALMRGEPVLAAAYDEENPEGTFGEEPMPMPSGYARVGDRYVFEEAMKRDPIERAIDETLRQARKPVRESADNEFAAEADVTVYGPARKDLYYSNVEPGSKKVSVKFRIDVEYRSWGIKDITVTIPEQEIELPLQVVTQTGENETDVEKEVTTVLRPHLFGVEQRGPAGEYTVGEIEVQLNDDFTVNEAKSVVYITGG